MRPYFDRYSGHPQKAIRHYSLNIRLAESLVPSLSVFEVTLRNSLIRELERMAGRKEWYIRFKKHPALKSLYKYIITASQHIRARGEDISADKINGELTRGFWVSLFNAEYEKYLWKDLRRAFPYLPKTNRKRKTISAPLNAVRSLRNRVFHNESISWSLVHLASLHRLIIQVIDWMNPQVSVWLTHIDRFNYVSRHSGRNRFGVWNNLCRIFIQNRRDTGERQDYPFRKAMHSISTSQPGRQTGAWRSR